MTHIYFVRHAEPNYRNHNDAERELSSRGQADCALVTHFLQDKGICAMYSSPYRRAVDTILPFAESVRLPIEHVPDFRERRVDDVWIEDFDAFCRQQWADFDFRLAGGESLREVQRRSVAALSDILQRHEGKSIVIGGHGTAISTVLNHYDPAFGHAQFEAIRRLMPWIVRLDFDGARFLGWESFPLK
ncbi:MAG: histidine phosphatase family protein [Clostridia bacterium]|nr:histidine phosphatase family protein [Clostridia bacterium]